MIDASDERGVGARMNGAQAVAECIRLESVESVFCVPGESYLGILDAFYEDPAVTLVANRHEGGAAFAAEAYAKLTGRPGVCLVTRGPGATNASIGVHAAHQDSTPMVLFIGQAKRGDKYREGLQEVDFEAFFRPITKWAIEIREAERVPELVQRAFHVAKSGRPGPVAVSLPSDMLTEEAEMTFADPVPANIPGPEAHDVEEILSEISRAGKTAIIAGGGISRSGAHAELVELSEKLVAPVFAAFQRHDVFPHRHPNFLGHLSFETAGRQREILAEADVVLAIGTRMSEFTTQGYTLPASRQRLIHVDVDPSVFGMYKMPRIALVSDARKALRAILAGAKAPTIQRRDARTRWIEAGRQFYTSYSDPSKAYTDNAGYADAAKVVEELEAHLPEDSIVALDAGNLAEWVHRFYRFDRAGTYLGTSSGAMGYALPAALAAKLVRPERTVVAVAGDGGFMMTLQELETAVRHGASFVSVVFNNNGYGTVRMQQELHFPGRVSATRLTNPNLAKLAEQFGAHGEQVKITKDFLPALRRALASDTPAVIEVITDPEQMTVGATVDRLREIGSQKKGKP